LGFNFRDLADRFEDAKKEGREFDASDLAYVKANAKNSLDGLDEALGIIRENGLTEEDIVESEDDEIVPDDEPAADEEGEGPE